MNSLVRSYTSLSGVPNVKFDTKCYCASNASIYAAFYLSVGLMSRVLLAMACISVYFAQILM